MEHMESFVPNKSKSVDNSIHIECTTAGELKASIKIFENGKSSEITIKLVKRYPTWPYSKTFAIAWNRGRFSVFKLSRVTPTYKKIVKNVLKITGLYQSYVYLKNIEKHLIIFAVNC